MKPNEFLNIIHGRDINCSETFNIDGISENELNFGINNKKRKLTNIESEFPKVLKLFNSEIERTNNISELLNSFENDIDEGTMKKFKKVLFGSKTNNNKINKHVQSITKKINELM